MGGHDILGIMNACILLGEMSVLPLVEVAVGSACGPRSAGEQADFLISGSETYEYVTHISVFSEILAIELITCSVTKLTPRM